MNKLRLLSVAVCATCFAVILAGSARHQQDVVYAAKSVRIIQAQSVTWEGKTHFKQIRERLINAAGEWKETTFSGYGSPTFVYSNKTGQYSVGRKANMLNALHDPAPSREQFRSTKLLREHKEFIGEGKLLGFKTFIWRVQTPGGYIEQHFAPEVSDMAIKIVRHQPNFTTFVEPISIEFIDVTAEMLATPDLPVNTKPLSELADKLEKAGKADAAKQMRDFAASKERQNN